MKKSKKVSKLQYDLSFDSVDIITNELSLDKFVLCSGKEQAKTARIVLDEFKKRNPKAIIGSYIIDDFDGYEWQINNGNIDRYGELFLGSKKLYYSKGDNLYEKK